MPHGSPLVGRLNTWISDRQPSSSVKLDRFLYSLEWDELFPQTSTRALPRILSDHIPILTDTRDIPLHPTIFRFENMWLYHDRFDSDVRLFWNSLRVPIANPCN